MKTKITVVMAVFIGFVLCSAAVAYYPALTIRECPHCRKQNDRAVRSFTIGRFGRSNPPTGQGGSDEHKPEKAYQEISFVNL